MPEEILNTVEEQGGGDDPLGLFAKKKDKGGGEDDPLGLFKKKVAGGKPSSVSGMKVQQPYQTSSLLLRGYSEGGKTDEQFKQGALSDFHEYEKALANHRFTASIEREYKDRIMPGAPGVIPNIPDNYEEGLKLNRLNTEQAKLDKLVKEKEYAGKLKAIEDEEAKNYKDYLTEEGTPNVGKLLERAKEISYANHGGDHVKEVLYNRLRQRVEYERIKPKIETAFKKKFIEKTGVEPDAYFEQRSFKDIKDLKALQTQNQTQYARETERSQQIVNDKADAIFKEKYQANLQGVADQFGTNSPEFKQATKEATVSFAKDAREVTMAENKRLNRLRGELDRQIKASVDKIKEKNKITDADEKLIDGIYQKSYEEVVKQESVDKEMLQKVGDMLPGGRAKTFFKSLYSGITGGIASKGEGLLSSGFSNRFTDWMRSLETASLQNQTVDYKLSGANLLDPTTYLTRTGKMVGNMLPMMAATAITKNPIMGGLIGWADETLQGKGDVYKTAIDEGFDEDTAAQKANAFAQGNAALMPLYFLESAGIMHGAKGMKKFLSGTAMELIGEEGTEIPQQYFQQKQSKYGKSFGQYLSEDAGNVALETFIGTLGQGGAVSIAGEMFNSIGRNVKSAEEQHIANILKEKGANAANAVLEMQYKNGIINETQLKDGKAKIERIEKTVAQLEQLGVPRNLQNGFLSLSKELNELKTQESQITDENLKKSVTEKVKSKEKEIADLLKGNTDMVEVATATGKTFLVSKEEAEGIKNDSKELGTAGIIETKTYEKSNEAESKKLIDDLISDGRLQGPMANSAMANPEEFVKMIAEQAHGVTSGGEKSNIDNAEKAARKYYGDKIVDKAIEMFPKDDKSASLDIESKKEDIEKRRKEELAAISKLELETIVPVKGEFTPKAIKEFTSSALSNPKVSLKDKAAIIKFSEKVDAINEKYDTELDTLTKPKPEKVQEEPKIIKPKKETKVVKEEKVETKPIEKIEDFDTELQKALNPPAKIEKQTEPSSIEQEEMNVLTMLQASKILTPTEKKILYKQYKSGVMSEKDVSKFTTVDVKDIQSGSLDRYGKVVLDQLSKLKGKQFDAEDISFEEVQETKVETKKEVSKQESVNNLLDKVASFNKKPKNAAGRIAEINDIKVAANELGLKFDDRKGKLINESGKQVQKRNIDTPSKIAEGFTDTDYSEETRSHIETVKKGTDQLIGLPIVGADGRVLSKSQIAAAVKSINDGKPNNGAKAIYDFFEKSVKDGGVELDDKATGKRALIPVNEYFEAFREPVKELTDAEIANLNFELNEDFFTNLEEEYGQENLHIETEPTPTGKTEGSTTEVSGTKKTTRVSAESQQLPKIGESGEARTTVNESDYKDANSVISKAKEVFKGDPLIERVINFLQPILGNKKISIENTSLPDNVHGFSHGAGKIQLDLSQLRTNEKAIPVALHEMLHEATRQEIDTNESFRRELEIVLDDIKKALKVEGTSSQIGQKILDNELSDVFYGLSNPHELIAEVFTNQKFNEILKGIEYKGTNIFQRIIDIIVGLFDKQIKNVASAKAIANSKDMADFIMKFTENVVGGELSQKGEALAAIKNDKDKQVIQDLIKRSPNISTESLAESISKAVDIPIEEATNLINETRGVKPKVRVVVGKPEEIKPEKTKEPKVENNPKAILNAIHKSENISEEVKKKLEESELTYTPQSKDEARAIAKDIIDYFGVESSIEMAESGRFDGGVNSSIFAQGIDRTFQEEQEATTLEDKTEAAERWADYSIRYDKAARMGGRFISQIDDFYRKSPLGVMLAERKMRNEAFKEWFDKREKPFKEVFDELKEMPEFQAMLKEEIGQKSEPSEIRKKRREKISNFFNKAKIGNKGVNSAILPPVIWDGAVEVMKQASLLGEEALAVIEKGVAYINKHHKEAWDEKRFRDEWGEKLKELDSEQVELKKDAQERLLDRFRKKLVGLSEEQKADVIRRSFKKLVENGALEYKEFKDIVANIIGLGELSAQEVTEITGFVNDMNAVQDAGDNVLKQTTDDGIKHAIKRFDVTAKKAAKSATQLQAILYTKPNIGQRIRSFIQLSTLGAVSLIKNPFYNIVHQLLVRFPKGLLLTLMDQTIYGASLLRNKLFGNPVIRPDVNIFLAQKGYFKKGAEGGVESIKQVVTGLTNKDYFQKEVHASQIKPFQSWRDIWKSLKGEKHLSGKQLADKLLQGTLGIPAEIVARGLNIGDKGFRFAAEGAIADTIAIQEFKLKGAEKERFIRFPKETAKKIYKARGLSEEEASKKAEAIEKRIVAEGEEAVFQQENLVAKTIANMKKFLDSVEKEGGNPLIWVASHGAKLFGVLNMPFLKTPINIGWEVINLVNPELAIAQSLFYGVRAMSSKGTRSDYIQAKKWMAHAAVGWALLGVTGYFASIGAISGDDEDEEYKAKEAKGKGTYEKPKRLNMSKVWRSAFGGSLDTEDNDVMVDLSYYGAPGMIMNMQANKQENMSKEDRENMSYLQDLGFRMHAAATEGLTNSVFQGTIAGIEAWRSKDPSNYLNSMINVGVNFFEPATIAQISKATRPTEYTIKGSDLSETMLNSLKSRFFMKVPPKVNIWGDVMERGGSFSDVSLRMLGVSKMDTDAFAFPIFEDFKRTGNSEFFPPDVQGKLTVGGKSSTLSVDETKQFQMFVGQARKSLVAPFVSGMAVIEIDGEYKSYNDLGKDLTDEQKDKIKTDRLKKLYEAGYKMGKAQFLTLHPEYIPKGGILEDF